MYSEFDVLGDAEARAAARILADRLRYRAFLEAGERFVAEKRLVVGGNSATRLLLGAGGGGGALAAEDFQYELYSGQGLTHARALADLLYSVDPEGLGHYTTMLTKAADSVFVVSVDGRDFFTLTHVPRVEGVRLLELLEPVARPAAFARAPGGAPLELLCAPPQIQLLQVYTALCSPARAGDWPGLLEAEASLRALLPPAFAAPPAAKPPGGRGGARSAAWGRLHAALCRSYLAGPSRLFLGTGPPAPGDRLQVTTSGRLEAEAEEVARLAAAAGVTVQWKINPLLFPTDWRLRRATVFVADRGGREAILDIFNAAEYELFPFRPEGAAPPEVRGGRGGGRKGRREPRREAPRREVPRREAPRREEAPEEEAGVPGAGGLKLATEPALLKFRLADLWGARLAVAFQKVAASAGAEAAAEICADFRAAAARLDAARAAAEADPEVAAPWLFPTAFLGRFEAADLALKREAEAASSGFRHPPYMPLLAAKKGGGSAPPGHRGRLVVARREAGARLYAESLGGAFEFEDDAGRLAQCLAQGRDVLYAGATPAEALLLAQLAGYRAEVLYCPEDRDTPFGAAAPWLAQQADALVEAPAFLLHPTGAAESGARGAEVAALAAELARPPLQD